MGTLTHATETTPSSTAGPVIVLHGPPGIGKTHLALRWARDHTHQYPDGMLFADLRGYGEPGSRRAVGDVLQDWLRGLGVPAERLSPDLADRAATLRLALAGKRILIVLDNVADTVQLEPLLPAARSTTVLILSRRDLAATVPAATQVPLTGLTPEHAGDLLRELVGPDRLDGDPGSAADLARTYTVPLALRQLGDYIAARADGDLPELAADAARELPLQPRSPLRAAFAWSYATLPDRASLLFRMLGLHPGTEFGSDVAAAMLGSDDADTATLLAELVTARLLQPLPHGRYRFHDMLRSFAADLAATTLPEDVRTRTVTRALSWYLHSAHSAAAVLAPAATRPAVPSLPPVAPRVTPRTFAADRADAASAWCDLEADNLLAMTELAFDVGMHQEAWLLPAVLYPWLHLTEAWRHWMRGAAVGVIAARRAGDRAGEAWCLHSCGRAHQELQRFTHARRNFAAAAAIREEIGDAEALAWSAIELGAVLLRLGQETAAGEQLHRSLQLFDARRSRGGVAMARAWLGHLHRELGDLPAATAHLQAGRELFVAIGDAAGEAWALTGLAHVQCADGDLEGALHRLDRSLQLRIAARDLGGVARVQAIRAQVLDGLGEKRLARRALSRALTLFDQLSDPRATDVRAQLAVLDLSGLHPAALGVAC